MNMTLFDHPENVCMTYASHFAFSMYLSYEFAKGAVAALIHAFYPDALVTHSSDMIKRVSIEMEKIGCR